MLSVGIALACIGVAAVAAAAWMLGAERRRELRRRQAEQAAARAALEYLTQFGIRCATAAIAVSERKLAVLIETEPQKKLRFSYIIEHPLRDYVNKATGLSVRAVYWRFPVPQKEPRVPEVKYVSPDTIAMIDNRDILPASAEAAGPGEASEPDDYFQQHAYQIEEVDWEQFNTVAGRTEAEPPDETPARGRED